MRRYRREMASLCSRRGTGYGRLMTTEPPDGDAAPVKDPADWTTGDEPATAAQRSYLETLANDTGAEVPTELSKAQASQLIDELRGRSPRVSGDDA
jgi:Protein of unknown function (DUF3072)